MLACGGGDVRARMALKQMKLTDCTIVYTSLAHVGKLCPHASSAHTINYLLQGSRISVKRSAAKCRRFKHHRCRWNVLLGSAANWAWQP